MTTLVTSHLRNVPYLQAKSTATTMVCHQKFISLLLQGSGHKQNLAGLDLSVSMVTALFFVTRGPEEVSDSPAGERGPPDLR